MQALRGILAGLLLALSTLFFTLSLVPPALLKLLLPLPAVRRIAERTLAALASGWVAVNNALIKAVRPGARWDVQGLEGLDVRGWYLVASNHQSWVDILVLQRIFHGRIPFLKFFLKRELIWVPVIGLAWWALDFPFMSRGKSRGSLQKDLQTTRQACEKFKRIPTSVMNFVEGTRATPAKIAQEKSPYRHLLRPKVGGLSVALATMGEQFQALVDVTIVYPGGLPTFWDLLCGRVAAVVVRVQQRAIPGELVGVEHAMQRSNVVKLGRWVEQMWKDKDRQIGELLREAGAAQPAP
ncbi:MAG TPA: acetyltransferase [Rubrivivax sp.]|nr:acetyltransferase [Rubrivivax sp.]